MSKRVVVTGAKGQLGSELRYLAPNYKDYEFIFIDREELDLTKLDSIKSYFNTLECEAIINCSAYTAVDMAETQEELAYLINAKAVKEIAKVAKDKSLTLIHISTDYVFSGKNYRPYIESDETSPLGVYGASKLEGEMGILELNLAKCAIIRTSWLYSQYGANFVKSMLKLSKTRDSLGVIFDQIGSPTYARDLAKAILDILPKVSNLKEPQIYHYSNEGVCSWYDFAKAIFELSGIECKVEPIESKDYPTPAKRPHYSILNKAKIKKEFSIKIPHWRDSLKSCLSRIKEQNG